MQKVLVTGTSSGIGEQTALYLIDKGVQVIGVARRSAPQSLSSEYYTHITGDLAEPGTIAKVAETCGSKLDGAVFNAGVLDSVSRIGNTEIAKFRHVFEINLFSVVALTQALLPALRASHGRAIYVSSGASTTPYEGWAAYNTSKAALNHFVSTLAAEEPNIIAISAAPGVVDTAMQEDIRNLHLPKGAMGVAGSAKFSNLKKDNKLVDPRDSGKYYGDLALDAKKDMSGQYIRYGK